MRGINIYFTIVLVMCFLNTRAQYKNVLCLNYSTNNLQQQIVKKSAHKIKLKDDISNCQTNLKLFLNNYVKILMRNTFQIRKIGYVNEEGIVFKTGKNLQLVLWYGY